MARPLFAYFAPVAKKQKGSPFCSIRALNSVQAFGPRGVCQCSFEQSGGAVTPRRTYGMRKKGSRWFFKYKENDAWRERAAGTSDYQEARKVRAQFIQDLEKGRLPNDRAKWTLKDSVAEWLSERQLRIRRGSYASEKTITRNLCREFGPDVTLEEIANIHSIRKYETIRLRQGISCKTVNNETMVLAAILKGANLWRQVADDYRPLRVAQTDVAKALTREETHRLVDAAISADISAVAPYAAIASWSTGARANEIRSMRLGAIHLDGDKPFVYISRASTKTDAGARYVALDTLGRWAFDKLVTRCKLLGGSQPEHYLCPTLLERHTRATDPLSGRRGYDLHHPQSSWQKEWNRLRKTIGLECRFHDLRHSYITRAAEAGVPLAVTQAQVGHMSAQMIAHYTHISIGAIHKAAEQIELQSLEFVSKLDLTSDEVAGGYQ
jgi:integrase